VPRSRARRWWIVGLILIAVAGLVIFLEKFRLGSFPRVWQAYVDHGDKPSMGLKLEYSSDGDLWSVRVYLLPPEPAGDFAHGQKIPIENEVNLREGLAFTLVLPPNAPKRMRLRFPSSLAPKFHASLAEAEPPAEGGQTEDLEFVEVK